MAAERERQRQRSSVARHRPLLEHHLELALCPRIDENYRDLKIIVNYFCSHSSLIYVQELAEKDCR